MVSTTFLNRASRPATLALLARVYLSMRKYDSAKVYADSLLVLNPPLLAYDSLAVGSPFPFAKQNKEILYQAAFVQYNGARQVLTGLVYGSDCLVDSFLARSYDSSDLRPALCYVHYGTDSLGLNGTYTGSIFPFGGLATDEVYLIRAECEARVGDTIGAASDLKTLLTKRWKTGKFKGIVFGSQQGAINAVLLERRKELTFRNVRWSDLRRLNKENYNITLTRKTNGSVATLPSKDKRYVLPIPPDVLRLGGITDNQRQ